MFQILPNVNVDWMGKRKPLVFLSIAILFAGLASAVGRQLTPGGTDAFNLGVDFQGGTVITVKFKQKPSSDELRAALGSAGIQESVIQDSTDKTDEVLVKVPLFETAPTEGESAPEGETANQVDQGRQRVKAALDTFGKEADPAVDLYADEAAIYKIVGTDSVGPIA